MAQRIDLIAHHAIQLAGFFEDQLGKDTGDIDAIVNFNLSKVLMQMTESSRDVITTVDNANAFIETGIFGNSPVPEIEKGGPRVSTSELKDTKTGKANKSTGDDEYENISSKQAALKNNNFKASIDTPREIQIGYNNKISGEWQTPDNEAGKDQFKENIKEDWRNFKSSFDLSDYAATYRETMNLGSLKTGEFKDAPQAYVAAAAEKLKYNSLGQRHSSDPKKYILEECIPCADRILALSDLLAFPSDFLDLLEQDIAQKLEDLKRIFDILLNPKIGYYDLCYLLRFLSYQCVPDLAAMAMMLLDFLKEYMILKGLTNNFGLAVNSLLSAILSPLLSGLNMMLDSYVDLIFAPIDCILDALTTQLRKLDITGAIDENASIERALNKFSPENVKQDLHESFNNGYKNSQKTLKDKDFPKDEAFNEKRPLLASMEALGTGLGFLFNSLLFARDWLNRKIETARKAVTDFITRTTEARGQSLGYIELAQQIGFILKFINTMIRLINKSAFKCDTDADVNKFMEELTSDPNAGFDFIPFQDLPSNVRETMTDSDPLDDRAAVIPSGMSQNISVYNGKIIIEKQVPNFGVIRTPVKFVKKCTGVASFGEDEKVRRWLDNLKRQ